MKKNLLFIVLAFSVFPVMAATHAVLPDEPIQPVINAAVPGDVIAIFGGTYSEDITINKSVRLVKADEGHVTLAGNITWNGVTNAPPFEGFTVGSPGKKITISGGTKIVLKNVDNHAGDYLLIQGASTAVDVSGGQYSGINQQNGRLTFCSAAADQTVTATAACEQTILMKATIQKNISVASTKFFVGYSDVGNLVYNGSNGVVRLIGSKFSGDRISYAVNYVGGHDNVLIQGSSNDVVISNCSVIRAVWAMGQGWPDGAEPGRGIHVAAGNTCKIFNNYVQSNVRNGNFGSYGYESSGGCGIRVWDARSEIFNNIIRGSNWGISAPFGASSKNNLFTNVYRGNHRGGVVSENTFTGDPLIVDDLALPIVMQPTSPCINVGIDDPTFKDLDGSRNDIGPLGGSLYDPAGWTTDKPVVISFDLGPRRLLKGRDTQVTISEGQAVAAP